MECNKDYKYTYMIFEDLVNFFKGKYTAAKEPQRLPEKTS